MDLKRNFKVLLSSALFLLLILPGALYASGPRGLHDFTVTDIFGDEFNFADLKGKRVMIVNTASKCGLTPQYEYLEKLYQQYGGENFVVIGFPANNFMNQEPGTDEEIITFCQENFGVTFPMMSKISVKGNDIHPLYQWLTQKEKNGVMDSEVSWNFQKYLINEQGQLEKVFSPRTNPMDEEIVAWITR